MGALGGKLIDPLLIFFNDVHGFFAFIVGGGDMQFSIHAHRSF
jgi:hypothetical protein